SRVAVTRNYAILPPEGIPESVLPEWTGTVARILTAPAMGARFAQYLLDVSAGGGTQQTLPAHLQGFFYVLSGEARLDLNGQGRRLAPGGFAYLSPGSRFGLVVPGGTARLLWLKKAYEPFGANLPTDLVGNESDVKGEPFLDIAELLLQTLLPKDL